MAYGVWPCREFEKVLNGVYLNTGEHNGANFYAKDDDSGVFLSKELNDFGDNPPFGAWYLHFGAPDARGADDARAFALDNDDDGSTSRLHQSSRGAPGISRR